MLFDYQHLILPLNQRPEKFKWELKNKNELMVWYGTKVIITFILCTIT